LLGLKEIELQEALEFEAEIVGIVNEAVRSCEPEIDSD
jgi:hypothetical protein